MSDKYLTVVLLEEDNVDLIEVVVDSRGAIRITTAKSKFDPRNILDTKDPKKLFDELARRLEYHWTDHSVLSVRGSMENGRNVVISLPGTLADQSRIISSSRLKILEEFDVSEFFGERNIQAQLVHDVEAIAWGEFYHDDNVSDASSPNSSFALILIDEGVGSKFILGGKTYNGAGVAGTISRLAVQPEGAFFAKLQARGNLEVFASRSWISRMIVENYRSLSEKRDGLVPVSCRSLSSLSHLGFECERANAAQI